MATKDKKAAAKPAAAKKEAPKKEEPKKEEPKKEEPKKEAPKKEAPKKEAKKEAPAAAKEDKKAAKPAAKSAAKDAKAPAKDAKKAAAPAKKAAAPAKESKKEKAAPAPAAGEKNPVPESLLKKRKLAGELRAKHAADVVKKAKAAFKKRGEIQKRAEKYAKEYLTQERLVIRAKRQARHNLNYFREADPKIALVIRIRGINRIAPKTTKILQLLRVRQVHNGVFVKLTKPTINMLNLVEPYITYGSPSRKTVTDLIYKRGYARVNKQRIPINDNAVIEKALGKFGIICIEDLIHEIYTCGPHFKEANSFLWPFKLSSPVGGYGLKRRHYTEGGEAGNREEDINKFVKNLL